MFSVQECHRDWGLGAAPCVCVCEGKDPQASVCRERVPTPCPAPLTTFPCLDMMNICKERGLQIRSHPQGFPGGSVSKESACNAGDLGSIPGSGRSPRGGHGNPLQYSCLENPLDGGEWWATVHGVSKESDTTEATSLSLFTGTRQSGRQHTSGGTQLNPQPCPPQALPVGILCCVPLCQVAGLSPGRTRAVS